MKGYPLLVVLAFLFLVLPPSLAISISIQSPVGSLPWGKIHVSVMFTDDEGNSIHNAEVHAGISGKDLVLSWNQSSGLYEGDLEIIKEGTYEITAWSYYNGTNFTDTSQFRITSSKIDLEILAPSGQYGPGGIPVKLKVLVGGEESQDQSVNVKIIRDEEIIWERNLGYPYADLVNLEEGNYQFQVSLEDVNFSSNFTVSREALFIEIVNPKQSSYPGEVPIDVDLWSSGKFVHHAIVNGTIKGDNGILMAFEIPEGQYHYSTEVKLGPGRYNLTITANQGGNVVKKNTSFVIPGWANVSGKVEYIPGNKTMKLVPILSDLPRRYYSVPATGTISVSLIDSKTGKYIEDGLVSCCVYYENQSFCFQLEKVGKPIPHFERRYIFPKETWYEIVVNASSPGYKPVSYEFPPIKVGRPEIIPPSGSEQVKNYIFAIISPEERGTYPEDSSINLRIQLLGKEGMPITDANVTASLGNNSFPLDYDINGEYSANTEPLKAGSYTVVFTISHNNTSFSRSRDFLVAREHLSVKIISPKGNITGKTTKIQAEVKDSSGDMVPDARVEAIMVSPSSGAHKIRLLRNLATGYYETDYQLDSPGEWRIKVIASKPGILEGEEESSFLVSYKQGITFTSRDVVSAAIVIASLLIIALIIRAIL